MEISDAALVEHCLLGNKEAYGELVQRHQHRVYSLALRYTRGDRDEADDLAQGTFVRAYSKLALYNPRYTFRNWVLSICANLGKNRYRCQLRQQKAYQEHERISPDCSPGHQTQGFDMEETLAQIPEKLRIPVVLKHLEGLSYEEIAQVLSIGVSAAKMRVKRGRDELVRLLGEVER